MGGRAQVIVVGEPRLADLAVDRIEELERRWSRFLDDSDVSRANRNAGRPVAVSVDTIALAETAVRAHRETNGAFDPLLGRQLEWLGYDRSFELVGAAVVSGGRPPRRANRRTELIVDRRARTITVPVCCGFDPGGIGKGLAADLVLESILEAGGGGALINLGGDLRVGGTPANASGWVLSIEDPVERTNELLRVVLADGAIATSSRLHRSWARDGQRCHHLLDPRSGRPVRTPVVAVTVMAASGWQAEALTKAVFVGGADQALENLGNHGVDGLVVLDDGTVLMTPSLVAAAV